MATKKGVNNDNIERYIDPATVETESHKWKFWKKKRYIVVMLAFLGFFNLFTNRVDMSVAIVAMTDDNTEVNSNGTNVTNPSFDWNTKQKGLILSSFFYGYILTQFLGGVLGARLGGHIVFGVGIGVSAVLTLITPAAAKHSLTMLVIVRILIGVFQGVTVPTIQAVWSRWAPPLERSRMALIAISGTHAGTVVVMSASGLLATKSGWESVFYCFGILGCIWFIVWIIFVRSGPEKDPFCSKEERDYILAKLENRKDEKIKHPWKSLLTSKPVYAIFAIHFSSNWGLHSMITQLPTFFKDALNFQLATTGFLAAIPYLVMGILLGVSGFLEDWIQMKGYLTTTKVRKVFNLTGFIGQSVFLALAVYILDNVFTVLFITLSIGFGAFIWSGFAVNPLDIAPRHASVIVGISNTLGTAGGIISPLLTGYLTQNKTYSEWTIVFFITIGIYIFGTSIFLLFASGEVQEWAKPPTQDSSENYKNRTTRTGNKTT